MLDLMEERLCSELARTYEMISSTNSKTEDSPGNPRPGTPAYWIFIVGLVVSICLFWSGDGIGYRFGRSETIALALFVFVPSIFGPFCRALGQNLVAAACASVLAGSYWTVIFFVVFVNSRESFVSLLIMIFFYLAELFIPALVVALATTRSMLKTLDPGWALGAAGAGLLCGMIGANAVIASKEAARTFPTGPDPLVLMPDIITINKCSQEFAASNPEKGYPESLGQLGPQGSGCVPNALFARQVKGFTITYERGAKDANGRIGGYKVVGRETAPVGKDIGSIFTDESGLIRIRSDGPHWKGLTWEPSSPTRALQRVWNCVLSAANGARVNGLPSTEDQVVSACCGGTVLTGKRKLSLGGYDFEYKFNAGKNGKITGFTVEARPEPYGVAGVRSYLAVAPVDVTVTGYRLKTLNVYATPEDRPATVNDPLARAAEVGLDGLGPATLCIECAGDPTHSGSTDKK